MDFVSSGKRMTSAEIHMPTAYLVVTLLAVAANAFSGVAAIVHFKPILPGMARPASPSPG
jgi:hypothetical protein